MKIHIWLIVLGVVCFAWWCIPHEKSPSQAPNAWLDKYPQEYMKTIAVWSYTEKGMLDHHLSADYWAYVPELQSSQLSVPHLTVYKPDNTVWHIDAKHGIVKQPSLGSIEQVELSDTVVLKRPAAKNSAPITLETEVLRYQPKKEYAETDKSITLTKPDLKITGEGMRAHLDNNSVELLHNVKSHFVASPQ